MPGSDCPICGQAFTHVSGYHLVPNECLLRQILNELKEIRKKA